jgi:hypothetical protein
VIDAARVAFNTVWIVGCALVLAAFSHAHWLAQLRGLRTRQLLEAPIYQLPVFAGLCLVSLGLLFLGRGWLEHAVWAAFTALFAWLSLALWYESRE